MMTYCIVVYKFFLVGWSSRLSVLYCSCSLPLEFVLLDMSLVSFCVVAVVCLTLVVVAELDMCVPQCGEK